jgi:hypothetical protein
MENKVALCLHGYFDSRMDHTSKGSDGYNHIKKNILDKADVDVFIHSWQPELEKHIREVYNPTGAIFEPQVDFSSKVDELKLSHMPPDSPLGRSPATILSHFYSIQKCFSLVDFSKYNLVIKSRFDLGRINRNTSGPGKHNPYPVQCINFDPTVAPYRLYMADWQYFDDGPADMWFYGAPEIMKHFTTLYDDVQENLNETKVNAIQQLKWWMEHKDIWSLRQPLRSEWE